MTVAQPAAVRGAGLGLRRALLAPMAEADATSLAPLGFLELAPENWMQIGGRQARALRGLAERFPLAAHGLSLSLGGPAPLDTGFIAALKHFLDTHGIADYSEHLSWCSDGGQLYDLLPMPFTAEAVEHVATRIREVQDRLERRIAIENVSYYTPLAQDLDEATFISAVLERADCDLLLDINNVHVNAVNHGYDAAGFLAALPLARVRWLHVAGHYVEAEDLRIDTHGADVIDPVWALLAQAYALGGAKPTVLERDFNIPPLPRLLHEVGRIAALQADHG